VYRPDRLRVLSEIARVLRKGGIVALSTPNPTSVIELAKHALMRWPALRRRLPSACFPEATDDPAGYHPYRYHHPVSESELRAGFEAAGLRVLGSKRFLWILKTTPDRWLGAGRSLERAAESLPGVRRLGATTLVWAERA
jgi:SAM-dependent methyltransferase